MLLFVKRQPFIVTSIKMGKLSKPIHNTNNFSLTLDHQVFVCVCVACHSDTQDEQKNKQIHPRNRFIYSCSCFLSTFLSLSFEFNSMLIDSSTIIPIFRPITPRYRHLVSRQANVAAHDHRHHTQQPHWSATIV